MIICQCTDVIIHVIANHISVVAKETKWDEAIFYLQSPTSHPELDSESPINDVITNSTRNDDLKVSKKTENIHWKTIQCKGNLLFSGSTVIVKDEFN